MSTSKFDPAELLQIEERLRQERETFDQRKDQEERWFCLRLRMGYTAAVLLPAVAGLAGYVLFNAATFSTGVVASAGAALFADILGLVATVWKVVLNPGSITRLEPITGKTTDATVVVATTEVRQLTSR